MFDLISIVEDDFDSSTISSLALTEWLRTSGLADKPHFHVLRDIDEMMAVKAEIGEPKFGFTSFEGTYKTVQNQDRRCWYLTIDDAIVLCSRYSYKIGFVLVEEIGRLRKRIRELEEENLRLVLEYTEKIEAEKKSIEKEIGEVVGREVERFDITVTTLSKCIGSLLFELTGEEETVFVPTAHDINVIMWRMGLIGTKKHLGIDKPNPYSVLTKFFVDYPGVAVPKFFNNQIGHNPEICYEAVRLNSGSEFFGSFIMDMKIYGIKNNIGIKK